MIIQTENYQSVQKIENNDRYAIISIVDPGLPHPPVVHKNLLQLNFMDIDEPVPGWLHMTREQARMVWEFHRSVKDSVDVLVIQCQIGISRSVAIAEALSDIFGYNYIPSGNPNQLVRGLILDVARESPEAEAGLIRVPLHQHLKVSICVRVKYPVNRLMAMILCLQRQSYRNWEAVIVTDGINADARSLISVMNDPRLVFVETVEKKGQWGHPYRNLGIQQCKGDLIGLTNDDNYYVPGYLHQMVKAMVANDCDLIMCDMLHTYQNWDRLETLPFQNKADLGNWLVKASIAKSTPWPGNDMRDDGKYVEAIAEKADGKIGILRRSLFIKN